MRETIRGRIERRLLRLWFTPSHSFAERLLFAALAPLAGLAAWIAARRHARIVRRAPHLAPAVVVIGNLVVGGTGKTPATIAVAREMTARGWQVGLLCGGYRARTRSARLVAADADPVEHGDEAVLLAAESGLPVAAGRDRGAALELLLHSRPELTLVLCDDGLQHPGLPRTLEIAVFDQRGAGNGRMLPAGPLREPLTRAAKLDALLLNGGGDAPVSGPPPFAFEVIPTGFRSLSDGAWLACDAMAARAVGQRVVAVAGIGAPERFFASLRRMGIDLVEHPLPDHAAIDEETLREIAGGLILMTTKDAVKCRASGDARCWALETSARIAPAFIPWLEERLRGQPTAGHSGLPALQGAARVRPPGR